MQLTAISHLVGWKISSALNPENQCGVQLLQSVDDDVLSWGYLISIKLLSEKKAALHFFYLFFIFCKMRVCCLCQLF